MHAEARTLEWVCLIPRLASPAHKSLSACADSCEGSVATVASQTFIAAPSTRNGGRANLTLWAACPDGPIGRHGVRAAFARTVYSGAAAYSSMLAARRADRALVLFERDNDPYVPQNLTLATVALPEQPC